MNAFVLPLKSYAKHLRYSTEKSTPKDHNSDDSTLHLKWTMLIGSMTQRRSFFLTTVELQAVVYIERKSVISMN